MDRTKWIVPSSVSVPFRLRRENFDLFSYATDGPPKDHDLGPNSIPDRPQPRLQYLRGRKSARRSSRERRQSVDSNMNLMISACGERSGPRT